MSKLSRGALIVVEGLDRTGKSTQSQKIVESLKSLNIKAEYQNFPRRSTDIGVLINGYLTSQNELSDKVIHLLFSANRWESENEIKNKLDSGVTLIVDRYAYSGVVFSAAKGLDIAWCKTPDCGLPEPDQVYFLTMPMDTASERGGYGKERYEVPEIQRRVYENYMKLKDDSWIIINADRSIDEVHDDLLQYIKKTIEDVRYKPIGQLWVN